MGRLSKISLAVESAFEKVSVALLALTLLLLGVQVFCRYLFSITFPSIEKLVLLSLGWVIFLYSAVGFKRGFHMGLDMIMEKAPLGLQKAISWFYRFCLFIFGILMAMASIKLSLNVAGHALATVPLPRMVEYFPLFFSGAAISFFALEDSLKGAQALAGRES